MRSHVSQSRSYGRFIAWVQRLAAIGLVTIWSGLAFAADGPVKMVVLGDSLSAGYGLAAGLAFPEKLAVAFKAKGIDVAIINAGVSGDTASGGLGRLEWSIPDGTEAVILELGANDALRGLDPGLTRKALDTALTKLKDRKIAVLLASMYAPRNMGADYAKSFDAIFPELAAQHGAILYPFFLEGVAGDAKLNQPDGLHPTAAGIDVIVKNIMPKAEELIERVKAARTKN